jgi:hypothetical protein
MLPLNEVRSDLGFLWELKCGGGCSVLLRKGFDVCFIVIDSGTHREKKSGGAVAFLYHEDINTLGHG